jgi:hypothetical protein
MHITNRQVARYMDARTTHTQAQAAALADFSIRTARRIDHQGRPARPPRDYRTRPDPLESVWESVLLPELQRDGELRPVTLLRLLQERFPGQYPDGLLRTLERRVRQWRAIAGPDRERMFPQEHPPGWQGLIDFTVCDALGVSIAGVPLPHRLGHFVLAHSGWEEAVVILGGESYPALAATLVAGVQAVGGVPTTLRTDSLSAAYRSPGLRKDLTVRFATLCAHFGCRPTRNQVGRAHENGSVESPNGHLKERLDQALRLRGHRDFATQAAYRAFVAAVVAAANAPRAAALAVEQAALLPLPAFPAVTWNEAAVTVSRLGLATVFGRPVMVPARLIGHRVVVRLFDDRLEFVLNGELAFTCERQHGTTGCQVNYHLCIEGLQTKPGAFARLRYRDGLHPNATWARTWERLRDRLSEAQACQAYVRLLHLAHAHACEAALTKQLAGLLDEGALPDVKALHAAFAAPPPSAVPAATFTPAPLAAYDTLLLATSA